MLKTIVAATILSLGLIACSNADIANSETSVDVTLPELDAISQNENTNAPLSDRQKADIKRLQEKLDISEEEARNMLGSVKERADNLGQFNADRIKAAKEKVRAMEEAEKLRLQESLAEDGEF